MVCAKITGAFSFRVALLLSVSYLVHAQATPSTSNPSPSDGNALDEVIVTGNRKTPANTDAGIDALGNARVIDTPIQMQVFNSEELQNLDIRSVDQLAVLLPGATVRTADEQNGGFIQLRGFDVQEIFVDGQPGLVGNGLYRTGVPMELFDSLQIVKGASGFLYGFGYPGGVANYITKRPLDHPYLQVTAGWQQSDAYSLHVDASDSNAANTFGARFNVVAEEGTRETFHTGIDRVAVGLNLAAEFSPTLRASLNLLYSTRTLTYAQESFALAYDPVQSGTGIPQPFDSSVRTAIRQSDNTQVLKSADFALTQDLANEWVLRLNVAVSAALQHENLTNPNFTDAQGDYIAYQDGSAADAVTSALQVLLKGKVDVFGFKNTLSMGASAQYYQDFDYLQADGTDYVYTAFGTGNIYSGARNYYAAPQFDPISRVVDDNEHDNSVFASDLVALTPKLDVLVAARKIWFETAQPASYGGYHENDSPTAPTYAIIFKPSSTSSIYASSSESFLPGGIAPPDAANANQAIPAARTKQYEVGGKYDLGDAILTMGLFRIDFPYALCLNLVNGQDGTPGCTDANFGVERHQGPEFGLSGKVTPEWFVSTGAQYVNSRILYDPIFGGLRPVSVAPLTANVFAEYSPTSLEGLSVSGGFEHTGTSFYDAFNQSTIHGYNVFSLGSNFKPGGKAGHWVVRFNIENLLDKEYYNARQDLSPGAPRTLHLSGTWTM